MPVSTGNLPASIVQPGVCTSTTRPANPYVGQAIFESDTGKLLIYRGTAGTGWWTIDEPWNYVQATSTSVVIDQGILLNIGKSIVSAKYKRRMGSVIWQGGVLIAGNPAVDLGTGGSPVLVNLPIVLESLTTTPAGIPIGSGLIYDSSVTTRYQVVPEINNTTSMGFGANVSTGGLWGTNPGTALRNADAIRWTVEYPYAPSD